MKLTINEAYDYVHNWWITFKDYKIEPHSLEIFEVFTNYPDAGAFCEADIDIVLFNVMFNYVNSNSSWLQIRLPKLTLHLDGLYVPYMGDASDDELFSGDFDAVEIMQDYIDDISTKTIEDIVIRDYLQSTFIRNNTVIPQTKNPNEFNVIKDYEEYDSDFTYQLTIDLNDVNKIKSMM